ncbi:L-asparaginase [Aureimonas sp. SA4125]|uniref:asparaginase n=1 Tax=Aureimonas sp. SA4125 TaxID=2826993 RepID=UPI001CC60E16|nr:asparaginase [Aureimonas sp. SA4125]BDA85147.1 L-asparaginase [Aureimonas sp. SA4125]
MKKVCLITTGGTIASRAASVGGDVIAGDSGTRLRESLNDPLDGIDLVVDDFCSVGSFAIDLALAFALTARIRAHLADNRCTGVVVAQGTDTMEESAYLADLLVPGDNPIVFTGAQRNAGMPDTDGPRNLADAIRLAASSAARGLGAVICFEGEIHAARDATKTHTSRTDTFRSGEHGKLGEVDDGTVIVQRRPVGRRVFDPAALETEVELIKLVMGSTDRYLRFAAASGTRAFVLEAFGIGNTPPVVTAAVADVVASGIPVIVTSRCPQGRVRPVYGNGGGKDLERAGAIFAGDLNGPKARIAAAVLLGQGLAGDDLRRAIQSLAP